MVWIRRGRKFGIAGLLALHLFYRRGSGKLGSLVVVRAEVKNFAVVVIWISIKTVVFCRDTQVKRRSLAILIGSLHHAIESLRTSDS